MTPAVLQQTVSEVWSRLRSSPVGANLANGCWEELLRKQIEHPERAVEIVTTIAVEFGGAKGGWFSLWRAGGGLKAIIWVSISPRLYRNSDARSVVEELRRGLSSIQHLGEIQLRLKEPHDWLASKGWPIINGPCDRH